MRKLDKPVFLRSKMSEPVRYYYGLRDGYDIGDIITVGVHSYEIIEIDQVNQLMLIEEIEC